MNAETVTNDSFSPIPREKIFAMTKKTEAPYYDQEEEEAPYYDQEEATCYHQEEEEAPFYDQEDAPCYDQKEEEEEAPYRASGFEERRVEV